MLWHIKSRGRSIPELLDKRKDIFVPVHKQNSIPSTSPTWGLFYIPLPMIPLNPFDQAIHFGGVQSAIIDLLLCLDGPWKHLCGWGYVLNPVKCSSNSWCMEWGSCHFSMTLVYYFTSEIKSLKTEEEKKGNMPLRIFCKVSKICRWPERCGAAS